MTPEVIKTDPSVGELLGTLARDMGVLVRQEVRLVSAEMTLKAKSFARNTLLVVLGGALGIAGLLVLIAAAIAALDTILPLWLSALIIGVVILGVGYLFIQKGLNAIRHIDPLPEQTIETIKDDVAWAKEQAR
jgi:hypothetical protein